MKFSKYQIFRKKLKTKNKSLCFHLWKFSKYEPKVPFLKLHNLNLNLFIQVYEVIILEIIKNEIIKRDAIYIKKGNNLVSIFLSGMTDFKYIFQILRLNKIIRKNIK